MNNDLISTITTMKPYNAEKFWIDRDIVPEMKIRADRPKDALEKYRQRLYEEHGIDISDTALKTKKAMYVDSESGQPLQVGYVITGLTAFDNGKGKMTNEYIDLWVEVLTIVATEF